MKQASENDGQVIFDSKGYTPFEIKLNGEWAKKEWDEIITRICANVGLSYSDTISVVDRYLRPDF